MNLITVYQFTHSGQTEDLTFFRNICKEWLFILNAGLLLCNGMKKKKGKNVIIFWLDFFFIFLCKAKVEINSSLCINVSMGMRKNTGSCFPQFWILFSNFKFYYFLNEFQKMISVVSCHLFSRHRFLEGIF